LSPLTVLLQCLPKEGEDTSCEVIKAKRKKLDRSLADTLIYDSNAYIQLAKLTVTKLDMISQNISKSSCKEIFLVVRLLLKSITDLNTQAKVHA